MTAKSELDLPLGFKAAGVEAGIKKSGGKDMTLIASEPPATVAGTFTKNQVTAATVKLCKERLAGGVASAVIINSGNANACTGEQGQTNAVRMATLSAEALGLNPNTVFVCSTGTIGKQLPMDIIEAGIAQAVAAVSHHGGMDAAKAIMTTDTVPKVAAVDANLGGKPSKIVAIAKGAGMIEPNMATMLCFIMTDVAVDQAALQACLSDVVDQSFNRITVDGDMSTNDTVLFMANGVAGGETLNAQHADWPLFCDVVQAMTMDLAIKMVADGEGAHKVVTICVTGAASDEDAEIAARSVANSLLVKTSWVENSASWGRVMDSLGYSAAKVEETKVDIHYDDLQAVQGGLAGDADPEALKKVVGGKEFAINVNLNLGEGEAVVYTCECTEEYVRINI